MLMQLPIPGTGCGRPAAILPWPSDQQAPRLRQLGPERALFHEGAPAEFAFEVVSGMLKLVRTTADGRELILDFPVPGDIVGLADDEGYPYAAHVIVCAEVRVIPRRSLLRAASAADGSEQLLALACRQARAGYDHLQLLSLRHPLARIAAFLLRMAARQAPAAGPARALALPMARQDIAKHLALAPETLCRFLRKLREAGVINPVRFDLIEIADFDRLARLADGGRLVETRT